MSIPSVDFSIGSLYIAGFAQAGAPHVGLIIPTSVNAGTLVHIRVDRETSPTWQYQARQQRISGEMTLTSLLKIHDITNGPIPVAQLCDVASKVSVPNNDCFGECAPWVYRTIEALRDKGLIRVVDLDGLASEFGDFANGNKAFARRDRFPNVAVSAFCE